MMPYLNPPTSHNPMLPNPAQTSWPHAVGIGPQQSSMHPNVISTSRDASVGGAASSTAATTSSGGQCLNSSRKFICDRCGKGYAAKHNLDYHIRGHDGVKPFECEYCGKAYRSLSDLRRHLTKSKSPCVLKHLEKAQTGAK
ncbi:B-cell lymphoma/leukemia 11A [Paramarasmius palmivorus]|uniref:B-cell lymphoma/leukemia 11A n=1 Tax=Paramarasmius palmivorus TaxID=297713 RepID=A0AAW0C7S7_9AGAR